MRVARKESIIDEEVFFDRELWITTLKVASTIVARTMAEDQVLGARWRANWIGLNKAQALDRTSQRHGAEQCSRYRVSTKLCKGDRAPGQDSHPLTLANAFVSVWQFPNDVFLGDLQPAQLGRGDRQLWIDKAGSPHFAFERRWAPF